MECRESVLPPRPKGREIYTIAGRVVAGTGKGAVARMAAELPIRPKT